MLWENFKKLISKWAKADDARKSGVDAGKLPAADPPVRADADAIEPARPQSTASSTPASQPTPPPPPPPQPSPGKAALIPQQDNTARDTLSVVNGVLTVLGNVSGLVKQLWDNSGPRDPKLLGDGRTNSSNRDSFVNDSSDVVD